jgi:hypothetical protein
MKKYQLRRMIDDLQGDVKQIHARLAAHDRAISSQACITFTDRPSNHEASVSVDLNIPNQDERNRTLLARFVTESFIASENPEAICELRWVYRLYQEWMALHNYAWPMPLATFTRYLQDYAGDIETMLVVRPPSGKGEYRVHGIVLRPHLLETPEAYEVDGIVPTDEAIQETALVDKTGTWLLWSDRYLRVLLQRFVLSESATPPIPLQIDAYDLDGLAKLSQEICQRIEGFANCNAAGVRSGPIVNEVAPANFTPRCAEDLSPADTLDRRIGAE